MNVTLLTGDPKKEEMKERMDKTMSELTNPFKHIKHWIKGEVMRLNALLETIMRKEAIEGKKINALK